MITLRPLRTLPTLTTTLLLLTACADDDSSATASESSSTTGAVDPSVSTTVVDPTADTSTGAPATDGSSGTATGESDTEAATDGTDDTGAAGLEIAGQWLEEFSPGEGITHTIDETRWEQAADFGTAIFHVDGYLNASRFVVARSDAANEFSPDLYSRFDWTWDGDDLYYCIAIFDAPTAEDALAAPPTDPSDLAMGCGGFPWSALVPIR